MAFEGKNGVAGHPPGRRKLRMKLFVLALIGAAAIAAGAPSRAHADYTVAQCVPNAISYTDAGVVPFGPYSIWPANECGGDHGLRLDTGSTTGWTAEGAGLAWR